MVTRLIRFFWGDLTAEEVKRFGLLSFIFFVIIGSYWLMRVMKDAQFSLLVGYRHEPIAKIVSLFFVALALLCYNKLIDLFSRVSLFYWVGLFFGVHFLLLGIGIRFFSAQTALLDAAGNHDIFPLTLSKLVGWLTFCFLESYGSLIPALFWSFIASTTTTESAKRGYGMIFMFGQIGAIMGASTTYKFAAYGLGNLFVLGGGLVIVVPFLISFFVRSFPEGNGKSHRDNREATGILEGFRLLFKFPYVAGLFVVTTSYEIIGTIVEYAMGLSVLQVYPPSLDQGAGIAAFKSLNGIAIGALSLVFALFGTSFFMRRLGLRICLMTFPFTIAVIIVILLGMYLMGAGAIVMMWAFFFAEVVFRGLNYTLNNPSKEVMYIPTSADVKFKAKSWIDMFGSRSSKGVGALITEILGGSFSTLLLVGTGISLGVVSVWLLAAFFVGSTFNQLQKENRVVG